MGSQLPVAFTGMILRSRDTQEPPGSLCRSAFGAEASGQAVVGPRGVAASSRGGPCEAAAGGLSWEGRW